MGGVIQFYTACKKEGIKPLLGIEIYCTSDEDNKEDRQRDNGHLILIAKNNQGYSDLLKLSSEAYLKNFYYKPRIHKQKLSILKGNCVCCSACLGSTVSKFLVYKTDSYGRAIACSDPDKKAINEVKFLHSIFGEDFYLEVQVWPDKNNYQQIYNQWLINTSKSLNIPLIITSDSHYLRKEDYELHEILMAMQMKQTLQAYRDRQTMEYGPYFYLPEPQEMLERAQSIDCEDAYYNTNKIADKCNVEIELGTYREPTFKIEETLDYDDFLKWKKHYAK